MIFNKNLVEPPKNRPFLALCETKKFNGFGNDPLSGEPIWQEVQWIDGGWSKYLGFPRTWSTAVISFLYWMESPKKYQSRNK